MPWKPLQLRLSALEFGQFRATGMPCQSMGLMRFLVVAILSTERASRRAGMIQEAEFPTDMIGGIRGTPPDRAPWFPIQRKNRRFQSCLTGKPQAAG